VAFESEWPLGSGCNDLWLTKLSRSGTTLIAPSLVVGATGTNLAKPQSSSIVWTGSQIGLAWYQGIQQSCGVESDSDVKYRRFDPSLQPISSTLTFSGCPSYDFVGEPRLSWGRSQFLLGWGQGVLPARVSLISRDDIPSSQCGIPFTGDSSPHASEFRWNGQHFGVGWTQGPPDVNWTTIFGELYFRRVSADGQFLEADPVRVTFNPARTERSSFVWADGEWASAWSDSRTNSFNYFETFMTRMTPDGQAVNPPGDIQVTCCNTDTSGSPRYNNRIMWTGGEFGIVYDDLSKLPLKTSGDILFRRVDRNGSLLGSPVLVSNDTAKNAGNPDAAWNGSEYGVVWGDTRPPSDSNNQIYFARVGCNCTDSDLDGFSSCAGHDCVDSNPLVNPSRPETCLSGFDDNCDGRIDCQDTAGCPASAGANPGEVSGVRFNSDKVTLAWNLQSGASSYDILGGDLLYVIQDHSFASATCLAWRHPATSFAIPSTPPRGRASYFLVRGKADTCRLGTWGSALRDAAQLTCP
jgi:hypothetical protein